LILSETREELHEGKERAKDAIREAAWVRLPSRFLGNNNIGDRPL
jgi:hypothetical protein